LVLYNHSLSESEQSNAVSTLVPHFWPEILDVADRIQIKIPFVTYDIFF
jgi:hypothetical protein